MGKVVSVIVGTACLVLGVIALIFWWGHFLNVVMGSLPMLLILVGAVALFAGISEIKDSLACKDAEKEAVCEAEPAKKEEEKKEAE